LIHLTVYGPDAQKRSEQQFFHDLSSLPTPPIGRSLLGEARDAYITIKEMS
jgi:hypothetical protein